MYIFDILNFPIIKISLPYIDNLKTKDKYENHSQPHGLGRTTIQYFGMFPSNLFSKMRYIIRIVQFGSPTYFASHYIARFLCVVRYYSEVCFFFF